MRKDLDYKSTKKTINTWVQNLWVALPSHCSHFLCPPCTNVSVSHNGQYYLDLVGCIYKEGRGGEWVGWRIRRGGGDQGTWSWVRDVFKGTGGVERGNRNIYNSINYISFCIQLWSHQRIWGRHFSCFQFYHWYMIQEIPHSGFEGFIQSFSQKSLEMWHFML